MSTPISELPYNTATNKVTELPERDIPRETISHTTDAQVTPTYIPPKQQEYLPSAYYYNCALFFVTRKNMNPSEIDKKFVFFRNRAYKNRVGDVNQMKMIRNILYTNRHTKKFKAGSNNPIATSSITS